MEPMNATARYTPDKCEVWVPTQDGEAAFAAVLAASGLPADKCEVHKLDLGGGFGRRGAFQDYVHAGGLHRQGDARHADQAALVARGGHGAGPVSTRSCMAKLVGALRQGQQPDRPAHAPVGAVDPRSRASRRSLEQEKGRDPLTFQGLFRAGEHSFSYTIPNLLIDHAMRNPHVPPGFWRGVNINQNAIFIECFMDELAQAAGQDELEFRRKLLGNHPRNLAVLNAVAEKIGWGKPAPARHPSRPRAHEGVQQPTWRRAAEVSVTTAAS